MKNGLMIAFLLGWAINMWAQDIQIDLIRGYGGSRWDEIDGIAFNGYFFYSIGYNESSDFDCIGATTPFYWFSKFDDNFNKLQNVSSENIGSFLVDGINILSTKNGNYITGSIHNYAFSPNYDNCTPNSGNIELKKYDLNGGLIFKHCYGNDDNQGGLQENRKILQFQNGDLLLVNLLFSNNEYVHDHPNNGTPGLSTIWNLVLDSLGNVKSNRNHNETFGINQIYDATMLSNNRALLAYYVKTRDPNPPYDEYVLTAGRKIDTLGNWNPFYISWSQNAYSNFVGQIEPNKIAINTITSGRSQLEGGGEPMPLQAFIVYVDTLNNRLRQFKYWENNMNTYFANTKLNNSEVKWNEEDSTYTIIGNITRFNIASNPFIMKVDTMGNIRNFRYINASIGDSDKFNNLMQLNATTYVALLQSEGNLQFTGDLANACNPNYTITCGSGDNREPVLIKFSIFPLGMSETAIMKQNIKLFPNPTNSILNIQIEAEAQQDIEKIIIQDINGKEVNSISAKSAVVSHNLWQIHTKTLASGIYFVHFKMENSIKFHTFSAKFIKQ